jgi:CheY-like chemotaxis protein
MAKILVVDDDPDFVEVTRIILEENGHEVWSAADGQEAINAMKKDSPDLVLLDIMMSTILDGLGVSEAMHDDPELNNIPIIVVSSITESSYSGQFPTDEYLHVQDWIAKPVQPDVLLKKVRDCLKKHRH